MLNCAGDTRQLYGDGVFGGQYFTDQEVIDEVFNAAIKDVIELMKFEESLRLRHNPPFGGILELV